MVGRRPQKSADPSWIPFAVSDLPGGERIAARHGLPHDSELEDLIDMVMGVATRDLLPDWTAEQFLRVRREATLHAKDMMKRAGRALAELRALKDAVKDFEQATDYNPSILEHIFDVDVGPPTELSYPPPIRPVAAFGQKSEALIEVLTGILSLPLRPANEKRAIGHSALKKALSAIRAYWHKHGGTWDYYAFEGVERGGELRSLDHPAARFAVDLLGVAGFEVTKHDLARAWRPRKPGGR